MVDSLQTRFAQRLRMARELEGFSQEELAEAMDCHSESVSRWERAVRFPKPAELAHLAEVLKHPVAWFFLGPGQHIVLEQEKGLHEVTPREAIDVLTLLVAGLETKPSALESLAAPELENSDADPNQNQDIRAGGGATIASPRRRGQAKGNVFQNRRPDSIAHQGSEPATS